MQLALYKGPPTGIGRRTFHEAVKLATKGPYSHCELVIDGVCFSSSQRDGGVRSKRVDLSTGRWDLVDIHDRDDDITRAWFTEHMGQKYDTLGLLGFILPGRFERQDRWFCSEACGQALGLSNAYKLSPNDLYRLYK